MLDALFENKEYYDFPSFEVALFSLLLSFVLSAIIGLTYRATFVGDRFPTYFFQAIVLSSMVSSMVIMAVGNNLAAGFGIIGAIAIIRFRTLIRNPRNIIFIFASLSVGIATGVYGYSIALAGTLIFCAVAFLLHFSPIEVKSKETFQLQLVISDSMKVEGLHQLFDSQNIKYRSIQVRQVNELLEHRLTYRITLPEKTNSQSFYQGIISVEGVKDVRLSVWEDIEL